MSEVQTLLSFSYKDWQGIENIHVDQGPRLTRSPGYHFMAIYTLAGIKDIETEFAKEVMTLRHSKDVEKRIELRNRIAQNQHLHWAIKENLINNMSPNA